MTLYHIISDQVWQNLLPVLSLRPSRVIQIHSHGDKWKQAALNLAHAAREAGLQDTQFLSQTITAEFPDLRQIDTALEAAHLAHPAQLLNFTGGTKIHAIAAHRFATRHQIPSFYYDTNQKNRPIFNGDTGSLPDLSSIAKLAAQITIPVALAAHGHPPADFIWSQPADSHLDFALKCLPLRVTHSTPINAWIQACRQHLHNDRGNLPEGARLKQVLEHPLPAPQSEAAQSFADIAVECAILRTTTTGSLYLAIPDQTTLSSRELRNSTKSIFQLMEGIWWELVVYDEMRRSGKYTALAHSLHHRSNDSFGETDIVALDQDKLNLLLVSCKTQEIKSPLDHIQGLRQRANQFGGKYAQPCLRLFSPRTQKQQVDLENHCKLNSVQFICGCI